MSKSVRREALALTQATDKYSLVECSYKNKWAQCKSELIERVRWGENNSMLVSFAPFESA